MHTKRLGFLIVGLFVLGAAQAFGGPGDDAKPDSKKSAKSDAEKSAKSEVKGDAKSAAKDDAKSAAKDEAPAPLREYVGDKTCKKCHFKQHKTWRKMSHAGAWEALPEEHRNTTSKDDFGRECATCHTTGFGAAKQKGFVDPETSKHLLGVQCEACHGPGNLHIAAAKKLTAKLVEGKKTKRFEEGQESFIDSAGKDCRACHNPHYSYKKKYGKKAK